MRKRISHSSGRTRIIRAVAGLAVVTIVVFTASCSFGATYTATPPLGTGAATPTADSGPPQDALPVTAILGQEQLPPGRPGLGKPPVVVGSKNFPEQTLLAQLYIQALTAKGYTVVARDNIGGSEVIDSAFSLNQIGMYPEYLGEIVTSVASQPTPLSASDNYSQAKVFEEQQRAATILKQTPFQDSDAIAVTTQTAINSDIRTISDLNHLGLEGVNVTVAGPKEFSTRQTGLLGVRQQYNLPRLAFVSSPAGQQYQLLDTGVVQAVDAFTTDAALQSGKYQLLTDPRNVFGFQYVAPVIKQNVLDQQGTGFVDTCNWVSSLLTTESIQALNGQVQSNGTSVASIAQQFLALNGLE